jgi:hypothetical protein
MRVRTKRAGVVSSTKFARSRWQRFAQLKPIQIALLAAVPFTISSLYVIAPGVADRYVTQPFHVAWKLMDSLLRIAPESSELTLVVAIGAVVFLNARPKWPMPKPGAERVVIQAGSLGIWRQRLHSIQTTEFTVNSTAKELRSLVRTTIEHTYGPEKLRELTDSGFNEEPRDVRELMNNSSVWQMTTKPPFLTQLVSRFVPSVAIRYYAEARLIRFEAIAEIVSYCEAMSTPISK